MRGTRIIIWIITVAVVALPLLLCSVAQAESGCHDTTPAGGTATAKGSSTDG